MSNTQTGNTDPWFVDKSTDSGAIGVSSRDARHALGAHGTPSGGNSYGFRSVVLPGGSPTANAPGDLAVSASSGMTVAVAAGAYQVDFGAATGPYTGAVTSTVTVTLPNSNGSNPRIDYIVLRVRDPGQTTTTESAKILPLSGSPSANPVAPTSQLTTGDMVLAAITVRTNTSSILTADIADARMFGAARGGIYPAWNGDAVTGAYEGQYRDNGPYNQLERWSGSAWEAIAVPSVWNQFTPRLLCLGTGTDISIGTNPTIAGRYQLVGHRLDFTYTFRWGSSPFNGGYGDVYTLLPKHPVTGVQMTGGPYDQWVQAELWVNNAQFVGDFFGQGFIAPNGNYIKPYFAIRYALPNINMNTRPFRIATSQGVTDGTQSVPNIFSPSGFPEGGALTLSGSCEVAF